jgi:hypothetical protein
MRKGGRGEEEDEKDEDGGPGIPLPVVRVEMVRECDHQTE